MSHLYFSLENPFSEVRGSPGEELSMVLGVQKFDAYKGLSYTFLIGVILLESSLFL
jgi:hypothetical protein